MGKSKTILDQAEEVVESALDQAREFIEDTAVPALADAKDQVAEAVAAGATVVAEKATDAQEYAVAHAAGDSGDSEKKGSKLKMLLLFGAVAGGIAIVAKKLQGGKNSPWQPAPEPPPTPAPPPAPAPPAAKDTGADTTGTAPDDDEPRP